MNSIFTIKRVFYSSDDGHDVSTLIGYVTDEDKAIKKVDELNRLHEEAELLKNKIDIHVKEVLLPSLDPIEYISSPSPPKWLPGISKKEITNEMREEREQIRALQIKASLINNERSHVFNLKIDSLKQDYIDSLHINPDILKIMEDEQNYDSVSCYDYKKLEEM